MYSYEWDKETGGYNLVTKITGVVKEVHPVFFEELEFLRFDKQFGWVFPQSESPLLWVEGRRYFYKGEFVGEAVGGGLYSMPTLKNVVPNLVLEPVDIDVMIAKNESLLNGLIQKTLKNIYDVYEDYKDKVDMFYVGFSGGKDSMVMLDLVQRALPHDAFDVVFGDTTMELGDTYKTVEKTKKLWNDLNWHTAGTNFDSKESWQYAGPPSRTIRWCCGVHKTAPSVAKIKEILAERKGCRIQEIKHFKTLAFLGVRAEESEARSMYAMVSDGNKHTVQINCNPILDWGTGELFAYSFQRKLLLNAAYRKGLRRVGCLFCPMSSPWYECIINHNYEKEVLPYIDIIKSSLRKDYSDEEGWKRYLSEGGWKQRSSGKLLRNSENKVINISSQDEEKYIIKDPNYSWKKWMLVLGDFVEIENNVYSLQYKDIILNFRVVEEENITTFTFMPIHRSKTSIRFMYLLKNVFNKTAYCKNCKVCMSECPNGALNITDSDVIIKNCLHCESCLDKSKGCVIAKSIVTTGDNNMSIKNIDRYKNFGLRQDWVELYLEDYNNFWTNKRLGTHMFKSFEKWGKEAGLLDRANTPLPFVPKLAKVGYNNPNTWGYIYTNIVYNSPIFNWFIRNTEFGLSYQVSDLIIMLGDGYADTTKKNALSALKDTIKSSPIGWILGQGECEMKGRQVVSITRTGWKDPVPLVILYSLYKFAEHSEGLYSFTLSDLLEDSEERIAMSPRLIFGIEADELKSILQGLANNYPDYINVDFNKGIMDNIFLKSGKRSTDIIELM